MCSCFTLDKSRKIQEYLSSPSRLWDSALLKSLLPSNYTMVGVNRSQWKQWIAAMAATLAMVIVGTEEFWLFHILRTVEEPRLMYDATFAWTRLSIAATGSVIGAILGAVFADKIGRKKTLLTTSILPVIQIVCSYSISTESLWSCVPLFFGEIGLGMTCVVVPLFISEICDDQIRGALMMLQVPFLYAGKLIAVGTGLLGLSLVSVVIVGVFVGAFVWLPETPYHLASEKRYDAAAESLAFYRGIDAVTAQSHVQEIIEEVEAKGHGDGRPRCQKIRDLLRGSNGKGLTVVMFLIIAKWSEQKFDITDDLLHIVTGYAVPVAFYGQMITYLVSLISSILIASTIDVIGRRFFLVYATFTSFVAVILMWGINSRSELLVNGIGISFYFCRLMILSVSLVYIGELFTMNVKALAISIVTILNLFTNYVILFIEFIGGDVNSYILGVTLLLGFPITFAFIPETKRKSLSDIRSEVATTTFHCRWLKNKLLHTNQPADLMKK